MADAHLIERRAAGRYEYHDLLHAYAAELAETGVPDPAAATRRLLDDYLHTAYAAAHWLDPLREWEPLEPASPGVSPGSFGAEEEALRWFDAEHRTLLAMVPRGKPRPGDRFTEAGTWDNIGWAHHHRGEHAQAIAAFEQCRQICREIGDRHQESAALDHLGDSYLALGSPHAAKEAWQTALAISVDLDHPDVEAVRTKLSDVAA